MANRISFPEYCFNKVGELGIKPEELDLEQAKLDYEKEHPLLKTCVYLDDERLPTVKMEGFENWTVIRSFAEWVEYLSYKGCPDHVSFDHDLFPEHYQDFQNYELQGIAAIHYSEFKQQTGLECAQYYAAFCEQNNLQMQGVAVHCTERAMGAENIRDFLNTYLASVGSERRCFIAAIPSTTEREIANREKLIVR